MIKWKAFYFGSSPSNFYRLPYGPINNALPTLAPYYTIYPYARILKYNFLFCLDRGKTNANSRAHTHKTYAYNPIVWDCNFVLINSNGLTIVAAKLLPQIPANNALMENIAHVDPYIIYTQMNTNIPGGLYRPPAPIPSHVPKGFAEKVKIFDLIIITRRISMEIFWICDWKGVQNVIDGQFYVDFFDYFIMQIFDWMLS